MFHISSLLRDGSYKHDTKYLIRLPYSRYKIRVMGVILVLIFSVFNNTFELC